MDGLIDVDYLIDDYAYMRATVSGNTKKEAGRDSDNRRWGRILRSTKAYPDRILTQMYGLFALAKTQVRHPWTGIKPGLCPVTLPRTSSQTHTLIHPCLTFYHIL